MPSICFLTIAECPSYTAVHRRWSGLPCCCCPYLEQSAPACHIRALYVRFPRSPQDFPLLAFLSMTYHNFCSACAVTVVIFGHFNRSFLRYFYRACTFKFLLLLLLLLLLSLLMLLYNNLIICVMFWQSFYGSLQYPVQRQVWQFVRLWKVSSDTLLYDC